MTRTYEGWTAVEIAMPAGLSERDERLDLLSSVLFELGAGGLEIRDEREPLVVVAAFSPEHSPPGLSVSVDAAMELVGIPGASIELKSYAPIDWSTHWRRHFKAIRFCEGRLWVVPTWLDPPTGASHIVRIDPSSAFGTGLHATTALCLESIIDLSPIDSILDVGTGTGILAIAALRLGARRAIGTDNDSEALSVARENAERNGFEHELLLRSCGPSEIGERFALIVANILAGPLIELAPSILAAALPRGRIVLSGVMAAQAGEVVEAYEALGCVKRDLASREEWVRIDLDAPP